MKKRLKCGALALTLVLALGLLAGCGPATTGGGDEDPGSAPEETPQSETELLSGKHHVQIAVQDYGTITLELDADAAPVTVTNFVNLAQAGFYDGLTFHRIVPGFVIQGGDPAGNGTGGSDETIVGEFSANGHENPISHVRGTISMARSQDYDSAS
ncbi:MAG TPA: peptidylprolyl isomerase, partial [Firmicutes bacterium]|nr:peptidylprolyl isomerase [Bacillota bacterium]